MVYRLVAFLPGLLEFTLMRGETGAKQKKLAKLWEQLFKDEAEITRKNYDIVMNAFKNAPPIDRVVPIEQQIEPHEELTLPEEEVSFTSQKFIDESCTNCQICYRICPTGALSSNGKFSLIHFDAMLCVKCRLCHDACEPDSIHLQSGFEIKEFFEPTQRTLATFNIKRCNECGNNFTYTGGEQSCPRCLVEEEEAMFLHDNAVRMKEISNDEDVDKGES
jgi:ferredoxin